MSNLTETLKSNLNNPVSSLTETLKSNLNNPVSSPEFDLYAALDEVLGGVGLTASDSGGKITFYGILLKSTPRISGAARPHSRGAMFKTPRPNSCKH